MNLQEINHETILEIIDHIKTAVNDGRLQHDVYVSDIHHEIFNTDYYIIGSYKAEQWLIASGGVFNAIGIVREYELDQFGEITTDLSSSEKVANMLAYIIGEELLTQCPIFQSEYDSRATDAFLLKLIEELKAI